MNKTKSKIISETQNENITNENNKPEIEMPEGCYINEFGEIIRPGIEKTQESNQQQNENKLSLSQKVAQFLQKNNLFMNVSFVEKFVHQQLDVLPPPKQDSVINHINQEKIDFDNWLTNNGQLRNLPPIQRMSNP